MSRKRNLKNLSRSTNLNEESGIRSIREISRELICSDCRVKVPILKIASRGTNRTLTCNCPQCQKEISKTFVDRGLTTFENVLNKVNNYLNAAESMLYNIIQMYHEVLTFLEDCEVPPPEDIIDNGAFFLPLIIPAIVQAMAPVFSSPQSSCGVYAKNATTAEYYIKNVFRDLEKIPPVVIQIRDLIADVCPGGQGISEKYQTKFKKLLQLEIDEATKALNNIKKTIKYIEDFRDEYEQCITAKYTKQ